MVFVRRGWDAGDGGGLQRVDYRLREGRLERLAFARVDGGGTAMIVPLLDGVQSLRLRYRDGEGEWRERWDPSRARRLPRAVELVSGSEGAGHRAPALPGRDGPAMKRPCPSGRARRGPAGGAAAGRGHRRDRRGGAREAEPVAGGSRPISSRSIRRAPSPTASSSSPCSPSTTGSPAIPTGPPWPAAGTARSDGWRCPAAASRSRACATAAIASTSTASSRAIRAPASPGAIRA